MRGLTACLEFNWVLSGSLPQFSEETAGESQAGSVFVIE